ncbi:hypothetical protein [Salisediminibacterium halotolerans]|uniref:Cytochrome C and Quinol oxidase polypeptide I n=1 Tax=Salisediminibacterium halotolerans TaxID=517425 RepID=A0A1H9SKY9_9BACI|nr:MULTISPECIES: hypothetical protein [Salisediminibacterium]RLJ73256.1 hypothetical protein BCL39_2012 [Actinophytocola xinjiangensis]RPE86678.1 hypothetical protein EDD67_2135 [Salisediminibacterium halotolerans]TWG34053.1 hypothetical protein BCL52_2009 [Salisediminibacterium halotolerans]SER85617.1 hypothetical protein SAMN05444126_10751 [Salisediminibacterium haloalkalitolerans]GEL08900.1 hypothetical protein SHA02_23160 [Salisediminibacterium halotolerans]
MSYSKRLLIASAFFGVIGVGIGGHMAGAGSLAWSAVHAHILVVGWLSLFAWSMYYKVYTPPNAALAAVHFWTALVGAAGLNIGMYVYMMDTFLPEVLSLILYISMGTVLIISYIVFFIMTILQPE